MLSKMMVQDELSNYVLEQVKNFPQISVEDIENWLQEDPNNIKNREKIRNDLSLEVFYEIPTFNHNVLKTKGEIGLGGIFNNAQINNIIAEYEKSSCNILPENSYSENLDQILSCTDNISVGDNNLSPAYPEQTSTDNSHGNLITDASQTTDTVLSNDSVVNQQVQNNICGIYTEELLLKLAGDTDFSKIVPVTTIEPSSIQKLTNNQVNNTDLSTNLTDNCTEIENSTEHHNVQIIPNNYNVEDKGIKLVIKKNQPSYTVFTKGQPTGGMTTYSDMPSSNQIVSVDPKTINIERTRSNPKYHLEVVTRALATVNITDDMLQCTKTEGNQKVWACFMPDCESAYRKLCQIKEHLLTHFGLKPFQCDYKNCRWAFSSIFKLKRHKKSHEKIKEYICPEPTCQRRFVNSTNLTIHKKSHVEVKKFHCPVPNCNNSFSVQKSLDKHMRREHGEEFAPFVCSYPGCNKRFYGNSGFKSHQRIHNYAPEDVTCTWPGCGKVFDIPSRLKYHMISHTGEKTFQCPYCNTSFPTASKLLRHERSHRGERQYVCNLPGCGKSFRRKDHLRNHFNTHNEDREKYMCDYCLGTFISRASIKVHVKKHLNGHFERPDKRRQKRHRVKNLTDVGYDDDDDNEDNEHCARTHPFRHLNKASKKKSIKSGNNQETNEKIKKRGRKTNKVKRKHSEKENVAPFSKVQNNSFTYLFPTSPSNREDYPPLNQDIASTAFGEDYTASCFDNLDDDLLNEELPPIYTQENLEVPEYQIYNDPSDSTMLDLLQL